MYKSGDLIFLTRRINKRPFHRWFISNSIATITKRKKQKLREVKVHAAIIYNKAGCLTVRDMDAKGTTYISLEKYLKKYKNRIEIVSMTITDSEETMFEFNIRCHNDGVPYDFINTFFWQLSSKLFKSWFGKNTPYRRMCAEDASRMFNIISPIFKDVERTNPNEMYYFIRNILLE